MTSEQWAYNTAILQNLIDAGCDANISERFFELKALGKNKEILLLLKHHRHSVLERIREEQKSLDCLDYLINKLKKENN